MRAARREEQTDEAIIDPQIGLMDDFVTMVVLQISYAKRRD